MEKERLGEAALQGWRAKAADALAPRVARVTPLSERQVRAALGVVFLGLVVRFLARYARALRA
jgi:hypothetical protein